MLSNSPGGINFETAPFTLTREFLEVMDSDAGGKGSELFDYFKNLCIQVFLSCRKHAQHILGLVEMMQASKGRHFATVSPHPTPHLSSLPFCSFSQRSYLYRNEPKEAMKRQEKEIDCFGGIKR
mmetsp:Transcript_1968/g.4484  ORF Transcript_1968/g.4484 Transcript_1968/m.4484 type:complete len:124 (+) Transcript_1968:549-920(+)